MIDLSTSPLDRLPVRAAESHKGDFGRAVLIGGALGMSGAITLAGLAALRSGSGLVRLAVPKGILPIVAIAEPSFMTLPLDEDADGRIAHAAGRQLSAELPWATAAAIGPGLGLTSELKRLVQEVYASTRCPLVVDADGLNALATCGHPLSAPPAPRILTPHPGEFSRLTGLSIADVQADRVGHAGEFAARHQVIVILKGQGSVITDGERFAINPTGNPGMARGGSGDVLTGVVTALLAQGLAPFAAARTAAFLHGHAGDLAAAALGPVGMVASDLIRFIPPALPAVIAPKG